MIEALSFSIPLQHFCFPSLMLLFHDNKHGKRAADLATALVARILFLMFEGKGGRKGKGGEGKRSFKALGYSKRV